MLPDDNGTNDQDTCQAYEFMNNQPPFLLLNSYNSIRDTHYLKVYDLVALLMINLREIQDIWILL